MKKCLTRENAMGAGLIALVFFLVFVLPVLVGEAPPVWAAGGLAAVAGRRDKKEAPMNITLEPLEAERLPDLTALWSDPAVIRWTNIPCLCGREEAAYRLDQLRKCQASLPGPTIFAVLRDGKFCGIAGCPPVDAAQGTFGLFYQLCPAVWGQGVGTAAAELALEALARRFPAVTVYADVVEENTASIRILERLGFRRTAIRTGAFQRDGLTMDIWDYAKTLA